MTTQPPFAPGQRWLSNAESDLGLGLVIEVSDRTVTLLFPVTGEQRVYARNNAPLTRIRFAPGETITAADGFTLRIVECLEQDGLLIYAGTREDSGNHETLPETQLDHEYQLDNPIDRLRAGHSDHPRWYSLRQDCLTHRYDYDSSPLQGMLGARVTLIPHQLHIANEVANRYAPRVLLADEVGLGKTIEAALIIHQQLLTGRAQRVLIVVPSSLVHQWLVEMLRRVNLSFAIFDEERISALKEQGDNPFDTEQCVLCSLDFIQQPEHLDAAAQAGWDLLVVDEAHHLQWSAQSPSTEYQAIETLAQATKGVLLLTATPDQLGHESHFARLRLLDPARFPDYQQFVEEEQDYAALASAIKPLLNNQPLSEQDSQHIARFSRHYDATQLQQLDPSQQQQLVNELLDQHGTGRVLFRNTRSGIAGFPMRHLNAYPLALPGEYQSLTFADPFEALTPEHHGQVNEQWTSIDPRVDWLIALLSEHKQEKILTICHHASTALQLAEALRVKAGIHAGVFHQGMSIVERDRTANFFAQSEGGTPILICSEIGSEGRNFQFAHHLVLFDLPRLPDLLEQRIGRLDRIGQRHDIQLHVPYFSDSPQHIMLNWYHRGLDAFEHTCATGTAVFEALGEQLKDALGNPDNAEAIITACQQRHQALKAELEAGRDRLLELNASGVGRVEPVLQGLQDADDSPTLERFMSRLLDALGVVQEEKDDACYLLRPGESMQAPLRGLDEEGMTVTFERHTATALEQVHFLSWDHPMVQHAMDLVLDDAQGKSTVALTKEPALPAGAYWLECLFVLAPKAPPQLQANRFMPVTPITLCIDSKGQIIDKTFTVLSKVNQQTANQLIKALSAQIDQALSVAEQGANQRAEQCRADSVEKLNALLGEEIQRLTQLKEVNPAIRQEEIDFIVHQQTALKDVLQDAKLRLDAVRLVINNPG